MIANRQFSNLRNKIVTKFNKVVINFTGFIDQTPYKLMNLNEQSAITHENMVRYGPLSNLKTSWY